VANPKVNAVIAVAVVVIAAAVEVTAAAIVAVTAVPQTAIDFPHLPLPLTLIFPRRTELCL